MKSLTQHITEKLVLNSNSKVRKFNYHPETKDELENLVKQLIEERGDEADLNDIDTSKITDMSKLFSKSKFNGDISGWDVSNVTDMAQMFYHSKFNGDISKWNVSNVEKMNSMFEYSEFNTDISEWDVSNVMNMNCMFFYSKFNKNISNWNIDKLCGIIDTFRDCPIKNEYKPKFKN
jgi:surface protein